MLHGQAYTEDASAGDYMPWAQACLSTRIVLNPAVRLCSGLLHSTLHMYPADGLSEGGKSAPDLIRGLASDFAAHAVHGGIPADVGEVIPRVALGQIGELLKVDIGLHLHLLHMCTA